VQIQIVNGSGQIIKTAKGNTNNTKVEIPVSGLPNGTYYWKAINNQHQIISQGKLELL
jgi:hypothetical protein